MTTAIALAEVPTSSGTETQARQAIEARPKIQAAIEEQNHKIEEAELELARTFARDAQSAAKLDVESAFQKHKALADSKERTTQRTEALKCILGKVNDHLKQLKAESPVAVRAALTQRVETLKGLAVETEKAGKSFAEEIKKLQAEIKALPKVAPTSS